MPRAIAPRPSVVLGIALMLCWVAAYRHLSPLDRELFQFSGGGLRGLSLYLVGRYGEAARAYRSTHWRLWNEYADDPYGAYALAAGHGEEAERRARTTLLLVPTAVEPLVTLGDLALERGRLRDARAHLEAVLDRRPDHVDALYLSGLALARLGEPGPAIDRFNRALRQGTAGTRPTVLFQVMAAAGDLARRPDADRPLCFLAHLHRYLRIFDPSQGAVAMAYAQQAVAGGDRPADAYLTIGVVHDKSGDHGQALLALRQAVAADPRHAEAYRWAAVQARHLREPLVEYRMIRAAFESAPSDPYYLGHLRRVVLEELGDAHTMVQLMQRAVDADPKSATAHELLARAAALTGDGARAEAHARAAARLREPGAVQQVASGPSR